MLCPWVTSINSLWNMGLISRKYRQLSVSKCGNIDPTTIKHVHYKSVNFFKGDHAQLDMVKPQFLAERLLLIDMEVKSSRTLLVSRFDHLLRPIAYGNRCHSRLNPHSHVVKYHVMLPALGSQHVPRTFKLYNIFDKIVSHKFQTKSWWKLQEYWCQRFATKCVTFNIQHAKGTFIMYYVPVNVI